jgi:catechol 2,3-dioxygenase-like lactoylglutathione lyase family enzyme
VPNLTTVEAKAFVPARDFALSKRFYQDLGFDLAWSGDHLAYFRHGNSSFLLQDFYNAEHAGNFMMHLLVEDVDAWWRHVEAQGIAAKYGVKTEPPEDRPWAYATSCLSIRPESCGASARIFPVARKR